MKYIDCFPFEYRVNALLLVQFASADTGIYPQFPSQKKI